jgi:hypothetical protein
MSEAAMNLNCDVPAREYDIGPAGQGTNMKPEAKSTSVKRFSQRHFGRGMPRADLGHHS